jgi:hypothetical protein
MLFAGVSAGGCEENTWDSLVMLWNSPTINAVSALFFLSVVGMNVFGLFVTLTLGSVFRAVLLTARTALVSLPAFHMHVVCFHRSWDSQRSDNAMKI